LASSISCWTGHDGSRKSNGGEGNVDELHLEWWWVVDGRIAVICVDLLAKIFRLVKF
jgi:hypothetical protein